MTALPWTADVLDFWFGLDPEQHWETDPALDAKIKERSLGLWETEQSRPVEDFLSGPDTVLAAMILFDQFPRNMFRGSARSFATDPLALDIAKAAIDRNLDQLLDTESRHFLYMPFEHSEALADQDRSIALFDALGSAYYLKYAREHRDLIVRFGRFPHRNALLGRASTPEEAESGLDKPW